MAKSKIVTLPLHMKGPIIEMARIACAVDGADPAPENLEPYIQHFAAEAYNNSLTPNPSTPQVSDTVWAEFPELFDHKIGKITELTPNSEVASSYRNQVKAAVVHLAQIYLRLVAKKGPYRRDESKKPTEFPKAPPGKSLSEMEKKRVEMERYRRVMLVVMLTEIIERILAISPADLQSYLDTTLKWDDSSVSWNQLKSKKRRRAFVAQLKSDLKNAPNLMSKDSNLGKTLVKKAKAHGQETKK